MIEIKYFKENGSVKDLTGADLRQSTVKEALKGSLIGDNVPINTLSFTVKDTSGYFDTFTRHGDRIELRKDGKLIAKYWADKVASVGDNSNRYEISGVSIAGILEALNTNGGMYTSVTAGELIRDLMGDRMYSIDSSLANVALNGWLPQGTRRDALQQVMFATGASIQMDENCDPVFTFEFSNIAEVHNEAYSGGKVAQNDEAASIVYLTEHSFFASQVEPDQQLFSNIGEPSADHYELVFEAPYHTLVASGLTIHEAGANYCIISGNGTLTGKPYVHIQRVRNKTTGARVNDDSVSVDNAYLVSPLNGEMCLNRLANYYGQVETVSVDLVGEAEYPGALCLFPDPKDYTRQLMGYVKDVTKTFSSITKESVNIASGWKPKYYGNSYDSYLIVKPSDIIGGRWTVPESLRGKQALIVLFGGSQGGQGGWYGETGGIERGITTKFSVTWTYKYGNRQVSKTMSFYESPPLPHTPKGGKGGEGGHVGRMIQISIPALESSYAVSFGLGGAGGKGGTVVRTKNRYSGPISMQNLKKVDPTDGLMGTDSVFETFSTENGQYINAAYVNIIDGEVLAGQGDSGTPGADGGECGEAGTYIVDNDPSYSRRYPQFDGKPGKPLGDAVGGAGAIGASDMVSEIGNGDDDNYYCPSIPTVGYIHYPLHGGAGGGGAAVGANGLNGYGKCTANSSGASGYQESRPVNFSSTNMQFGGDGAKPTVIPGQKLCFGGGGGHGGGGGGSAPHVLGYSSVDIPTSDPEGNTRYFGIGIGGKGGDGGDGGQGSDGFAIVFYREAEE